MVKNAQSLETRDGCRLAYEITGEGLPLILIHGWTLNRALWTSQVPVFSQYFKTIIYDRRGYGDSDGTPDLRKDLDDFTDLLNHFDIESSYVLGMSQGGRLALRYSMTHPERIKALILQSASLDGYVPRAHMNDQIPLARYSRLIKQGDIHTFRDEWMEHPFMHVPASNLSVKKHVREIINRYSGEDLTEDMMERRAFPINVSDNLQNITMPTLIIEGNEETALLKDVANKLHDGIRGSKKIVLTGGGHLINLIEPDKYNQAVIDFLQSLSRI